MKGGALPSEKLRTDLTALTPLALQRRAEAIGMDGDALDEADDKGDIIELILAHTLQVKLKTLGLLALVNRAQDEGVDKGALADAGDKDDIIALIIAQISKGGESSAPPPPRRRTVGDQHADDGNPMERSMTVTSQFPALDIPAQVAPSARDKADLRARLKSAREGGISEFRGLDHSELIERLRESGVDEAVIGDAVKAGDSKDNNEALIRLILRHHPSNNKSFFTFGVPLDTLILELTGVRREDYRYTPGEFELRTLAAGNALTDENRLHRAWEILGDGVPLDRVKRLAQAMAAGAVPAWELREANDEARERQKEKDEARTARDKERATLYRGEERNAAKLREREREKEQAQRLAAQRVHAAEFKKEIERFYLAPDTKDNRAAAARSHELEVSARFEKLRDEGRLRAGGDSSGGGGGRDIPREIDDLYDHGYSKYSDAGGGPPATRERSGGSVEEFPRFQSFYMLGSGAYGKVYLVKKTGGGSSDRDNGNFYALKELKKEDSEGKKTKEKLRKAAVNERNLLEEVTERNVPFCVEMHYSFQTLDNYYIVQPYIGEDLLRVLEINGKLSAKAVIFYAAQVTLALEALHKLNIVHRDIKPENLMIDSDGYLVVIDLGLAGKCREVTSGLTEIRGTPAYFAPELLQGSGYGKAIDWWALGTLMYELMSGVLPFHDTNKRVMYTKIAAGNPVFPGVFDMNKNARNATDLIRKLLKTDPGDRLTDPTEIKTHPFFETMNWDRLKAKDYKPPYIPSVDFGGKLKPGEIFQGLPEEKIHDADREFEYFAHCGESWEGWESCLNPISDLIQGLIDPDAEGGARDSGGLGR